MRSTVNKTEPIDFSQSPKVDKVGVEERVARFQTRSLKGASKLQGLKLALNMIDLTTLEGKDTPIKYARCVTKQNIFTIHIPDYQQLPLFVCIRQW